MVDWNGGSVIKDLTVFMLCHCQQFSLYIYSDMISIQYTVANSIEKSAQVLHTQLIII